MNSEGGPCPSASAIAEQILQRIYGDDFTGCNVAPDEIASLVDSGLESHRQRTAELLDLYDKVVEAIDLLSTPPEPGKITDPAALNKTLSQRLDAIRAVTTKTRETVAKFKGASGAG